MVVDEYLVDVVVVVVDVFGLLEDVIICVELLWWCEVGEVILVDV